MTSPLVSVIVLSHRKEFFPAAIDSVVAQTYPNIEIILKFNPGPYYPEKFNEAWAGARGKYLVFLPDDDTLEPDFVARHVAVAEDELACMVYSDFYVTGPLKLKWHFPAWTATALRLFCVPYMTFLVRRDVFADMAGWDGDMIYADRDFGLRLWLRGAKVVHIPREFLWSRLHHGTAGSNLMTGAQDQEALAQLRVKFPSYEF